MVSSESTPLIINQQNGGGGSLSEPRPDGLTVRYASDTGGDNPSISSNSVINNDANVAAGQGGGVIPVLMEVVGGRNLPVGGNAAHVETYCVIQYGIQTIHRTAPYAPKVTRVEKVSRAFALTGDGGGGGSRSNNTTPNDDDDVNYPDTGQDVGTSINTHSISTGSGTTRRKPPLQRKVENPIWTSHHDSMFICNINVPRDVDNHKAVVISVWTRQRPKTLREHALAVVATPIVQGRRAAGTLAGTASLNRSMNRQVNSSSGTVQQSPKNNSPNNKKTTPSERVRLVGKIRIPAPDILNMYCPSTDELPERIELQLVDDMGNGVTSEGDDMQPALLAFRCRVASPGDISFVRHAAMIRNGGVSHLLHQLKQGQTLTALFEEADVIAEPDRPRAKLITEVPEHDIIGASFAAALTGSVVPTLLEPGKIKVKPYPDPYRVSKLGSKVAAQYMTRRELKAQTGQLSRKWVQAGTASASSFGRLYIEVLSAKDLPNVDIGEAVGNQTDAFVSIIYADAMVETDVIDDELSPHFPPWSQRAFCFPIHHPHQVVYLAVFGFKRSPFQHRAVGRVEINPLNFQHNTMYDLHYALSASSHSTARTSNGTVRVRLRMEVDDERGYLLASLSPPPPVYINVKRKKSLTIARFTARGEYDNDERFQLSVLQGFIDEILQGYLRRLLYSVQGGLKSLMLWRNQVYLFGGRVGLPVYSLIVFVLSILAILHPRLFPGIVCLELALLLVVQMQHRINDPSPLRRCFGFGYYFRILITGKAVPPAFDKLDPNTGLEELLAQEKKQEESLERAREFFEKKEELEKLVEELEHEFIDTKSKSIIPLEIIAVLGKVQGIVGNICRAFRFVDAILTWEESSLSFLLTLALLICGSLLLLVPWGAILKWTGLLFTVVFLGPQNKILDLLYFRKQPTDDQRLNKLFSQKLFWARINQEENRKLRAFRHLLFGKYSTAVPSIMWTPHKDFPLPKSSARYHESSSVLPGKNDIEKLPCVPGQQLHGTIIPRPEDAWKRNTEQSLLTKAAYEKSVMNKQVEDDNPSDPIIVKKRVSRAVDEGFEVLELYDEELGFVQNVLQPSRTESIYELGVEILETSSQNLHFESAFRSVHDFDDIDDDDSKSTEDDHSSHGPLESRVTETSPTNDPTSTSESNGEEDDENPTLTAESNGDEDDENPTATAESNGDEDDENPTSTAESDADEDDENQSFPSRTSTFAGPQEVRLSCYGIEITESFIDEARFVEQSWGGLSSRSTGEQSTGSTSNGSTSHEGGVNQRPRRNEKWN